MSRKDAISLVSRASALYLTFWALAELTNWPVRVLSFVHSVTAERMAPNTPIFAPVLPHGVGIPFD
jgi:hypothetical protein